MKIILCLALCVFLVSSCYKDETKIVFSLPAKTQSGKNTFGFLLNSSVWTNYGQICFLFGSGCRDNLTGNYYSTDGTVTLSADRVLHNKNAALTRESISISLITQLKGVGTYRVQSQDTMGIYYRIQTVVNSQSQEKHYLLPKTNPDFTITLVKLDTVQKILTGEFSGKLFHQNDSTLVISTSDSLIISDGRFDIRLR